MKKLFILGLSMAVTVATTAQIPGYVPSNSMIGWWPFNGNANDESGNGNDGTVYNALLTSDRNGVSNSAYYFSSINCETYIDAQINTAAVNGAFTITFWALREGDGCISPRIMKFDNDSTLDGPGAIVFQWPNSNFGAPPAFGAVTSSMIVGFHQYDPVQDSTWVHFGVTLNSTECKLYQNGQLISTQPSGGLVTLGTHANFGRMLNPLYDAFNGKLDDIGVWGRALTAEEISSLYYASGVGMQEENYQKLSYYPNPASDELNIEAKEFSKGTKINLYDQMGRLLECKTVESELTKISMESLKAGHYHFRLTGNPKVYYVIKN